MVKAELSYNPYLLETKVKFNGQNPKINSLVEKYQKEKLQTWISKIPQIFYDEMNGYDFDLDFSGSKMDFKELEESFNNASVSTQPVIKTNGETVPAEVRLFFKNELEDVQTKSAEIAMLLNWLQVVTNRKFDNAHFRRENTDLFDERYTYLLIQAPNVNTAILNDLEVSIENINTFDELPSDLTDTPILFYVDAASQEKFFDMLESISLRSDVTENQLFFLIMPELNVGKLQRDIQDKGIKKPQIVKKINDALISQFLNTYPITNYIVDSIHAFRNETRIISSMLVVENEAARIKNADVHKQLDVLEVELQKFKDVHENFVQKNNIELPASLFEAKINLYEKIQNWRKKKTKYTSDNEAEKAAKEYMTDLNRYFEEFLSELRIAFIQKNNEIATSFLALYHFSDANDGYQVSSTNDFDFSTYYLENLVAKFMSFKEVYMVEKNESLFSGVQKLFGDQSEPKLLVEEITYSISKWREQAGKSIFPIANEIVEAMSSALKEFYEHLATDYQAHLGTLIESKRQEKDKIASQLSDDEKKLQEDNDWLAKFEEQLKLIERG